jgi:hypothetical protein
MSNLMHIVTKVTSNVGYINAKNILNWLKKMVVITFIVLIKLYEDLVQFGFIYFPVSSLFFYFHLNRCIVKMVLPLLLP